LLCLFGSGGEWVSRGSDYKSKKGLTMVVDDETVLTIVVEVDVEEVTVIVVGASVKVLDVDVVKVEVDKIVRPEIVVVLVVGAAASVV